MIQYHTMFVKSYTRCYTLHMKIIVTHTSPDWDAIGSIWLIKKFLAGWQHAIEEFVPAGEISDRIRGREVKHNGPIVTIGDDEVIHVDTGMGPLDHHQIQSEEVSAAGLTWQYIQKQLDASGAHFTPEHKEAVSRIVKIIVDTDHFKEVFWPDAGADYIDFSVIASLDGLKLMRPEQDSYYVEWGVEVLNSLLHYFENKIWAEREIAINGKEFMTKWGKGMGFETINDTVLKLAQKKGYVVVVRKDPRKGYVRIKARPLVESSMKNQESEEKDTDLTLVFEKLKKIDPDATWYLHVSKKMLLNGTVKNPKMIPTKLTLDEIIKVL